MLDLDHGASGVIGLTAPSTAIRAWRRVLAKSLMHGLLLAGMANCGKHFPGHGLVKADSHTEVPVDKRCLKAILADDARPYEWLSTSLTSVMPAHVIYPKVDERPAGFSPRWLKDILRPQLGFTGAVFSDDLSMDGARRIDGTPGVVRRGGHGGAERGLRPGAAVQPVPGGGRPRGGRRCSTAWRLAGAGRLEARPRQRGAPRGAAAAVGAADVG